MNWTTFQIIMPPSDKNSKNKNHIQSYQSAVVETEWPNHGLLNTKLILLLSVSTEHVFWSCPYCPALRNFVCHNTCSTNDWKTYKHDPLSAVKNALYSKKSSRTIQDVTVGIFSVKMFGSGSKKWFMKKNTRQRNKGKKPVNGRKKKWIAKVLKLHRERILQELDVNKVLPYLVYDEVFSLEEYKEILAQDTSKKRTELFLDQLSQKGPSGFNAFCSVLEEVCPHLLTCFLLDCQGKPERLGIKLKSAAYTELQEHKKIWPSQLN